MNYEFLADLVSFFHGAWVIGLFLVLITNIAVALYYKPVKKLIAVFFAMVATTFVSEAVWMGCPLTLLEVKFRNMDMPGFGMKDGSWMAHLLYNNFGWDVPAYFVTLSLVVIFLIALLLSWQTVKEIEI